MKTSDLNEMAKQETEFFLSPETNYTVEDFPMVRRNRSIIYFHFRDQEPSGDPKTEFFLYEYTNPQNPLPRWKSFYKWKKGWTLAFNPMSDYPLKSRVKYKLEVSYKNITGEVIRNVVYFDL